MAWTDLITTNELSPELRTLINSGGGSGGFIEDVDVAETPQEAIIKNGRYKDKNGVVRHFETNEHMVVVDDGQKTLKQRLVEFVNSIDTMQGNINSNFVSRANGDGLGFSDGRILTGEELLPKYYFKDKRKNGLCIQLFEGTQLGGGLVGGTFHVITTSPWTEYTGGIRQVAIESNGQIYIRNNIGDSAWSDWRQVVTIVPRTNLTLLNGWVNNGNGYSVASVSAIGEVCKLSGYIKGGTYTDGTEICVLPTEYRPSQMRVIPVAVNSSTYGVPRITINTNGSVRMYGVTANGWLLLDAVNFLK